MKNRMVKRVLAGVLASMMLLGDATGVLASNLSENLVETEAAEVVESPESTGVTETVGVTEETESIKETEQVESSEVLELKGDEEPETVEDLEQIQEVQIETIQTTTVSEATGPIYMAYFGLPEVLASTAAESTLSKWTGHRIVGLGRRTAYIYGEEGPNDSYDDVWKILDPATGLLWADGIFFTGSELESTTGVSISGDGIDAALAAYLTSQTTDGENKYDILERVAIKKLRLPTKAEMMTAAYGFNNVETADTTRKYTSREYRLQDAEDGTEVWVASDGSIGNYGPTNGYAPIAELDVSKVFMTVSEDLYGTYTKTDISENGGSAWTLLLDSGENGFSAEIPDVASFGGSITIDVTGIVDSEEYDKISMVLTDAEGDIVAYTDGYNSDTYNSETYESAPTIGEFRFELPYEVPMGTYTVTVFEEKSESIYEAGYVSNAVSKANVEITTAIVEDFKVSENRYGQVTLSWNLSNKQSQYSDSYTYCNIYRADSKDGEYELIEERHECYNGSSSYSWKDTDVTSEQGIMNDTYYYKITTFGVASEWNTELGTYETTYYPGYTSEVVTNADMYYGAGEQGGYKGAYIADENGNCIDRLTLHEGEAKELYVTYVAADGTPLQVTSDDLGGARWYVLDEVWNTVGRPEEVGKEKIGIYPAELLQKTDDEGWSYYEMPTYKVYIEAEQGGTGTYYLTLEASLVADDVKTQWYWQIPVTVVAAVEGETYNQREKIGVETYEEVVQGIRELMKGRDFNASFIGAEVEPIENDVLFDTYAEREGMLPDEGDYLYYQIGERDSLSTFFGVAYAYSPIDFNGGYYCEYFLNVPFITTAAEEAKVDAKVNALVHTKGGALYKYAHPEEGETVTDEQKIKAIYDWIVANVNPNVPGDRRTPIYHTVYHTLCVPYGGYPGSGTCGAFAVLFTRLSREMGIASKVIMGTDQAAHAYNIVELNGKWWFIDANTRRYLSDCDSFTRAQEQAHYMDERFIKNYLSKIDGNDYMVESDGIVIVTNTATEDAVEFAELSDAQDYIVEQAALEGNETVEYTITVCDGNMAFPNSSLTFMDADYNCYSDRVTLDLGGNTLVIRDGMHGGAYMGEAAISASRVHNGTISVGDDVRLTLTNNAWDTTSVYEDLNIIYKSTTTTKDYSNYMTIFGGNFNSKIIIEDSVKIDDFFMFWIWPSNVEINTDLTAKYIQFGDSSSNNGKPIIVNGTVTVTDSVNIYAADYEFERFISKKETFFEAPAETSLTIGKELNLSGMTVWGNDVGTPDAPAGTVEVALKRQFASAEDKVPTEQATVNWSGGIFNYGMEYVTFPMFHFVAQDYIAGELQENKAFPAGTTIGKVMAKGLDIEKWKYNVPLTSENLSQYITVETVADGKAFTDIEEGVLSVESLSADLSYVDESGKTVVNSFVDFAAAVAEINRLQVKRDYTITVYDDFTTSGALTMPNKAYVASLTINGAGIEGHAKLGSNGKVTLTSATILRNLSFENAAYAVAIGDYSLTIGENVNFASKVSFTSGKKGSLTVTELGQLANVTTLKVTAFTNKGEVIADTVTVTDAYLDNGHLYANKSIQITNLTLDGKAVVKSEKDFKITGTLYSKTGEAALYSRLDAKKVPYLNISGKVILETPEDQVQVGVYAANADGLAKLDAGSMLLNAKTATADLFAPVAENAGHIAAYPAENGYFLQKNKTGIYVYYADDVAAALYKGDKLLGYFMSFANAVSEIEALKNAKEEYTIAILADVNTSSKPAAVTLPSKAAKVAITSAGEEIFDIFYTGKLTLKTHTEFANVRFNPMNTKKQGVASDMAAGKFDLTLRDVEVGNAIGMAINNISGSKAQTTTLDTDGFVLNGSVTGSKELVMKKSATIKGSIKVTDLIMQGGVTLNAAGAISVTNIYNNKEIDIVTPQINAIYYGKSSKGASNLAVNGVISGNNEKDLELHYNVAGASKADYQLAMKSNKFTLNSKFALVTMQKAALSQVIFYLGDVKLGDAEVVKANKSVYVVDASSNSNVVWLKGSKDGIETSSYCLDFSQAVNEINNIGDADAAYEIIIGPLSGAANVTDTNTTDSKAVSAITMPKKGKAASVSIVSEDGENITYSGNIAYPGVLEISNVELAPTGNCSISGTKNVSEVSLSRTNAVFKDIKNVKVLSLNDSDLKTTGAVVVTDVVMSGASHWDAFGRTSVTNLDVSGSEAGSYIGSKQTTKTLVPMFTISGYVTLNEMGTPLAVKVYQPTATITNPLKVTEYKNVSLVVAPKENADRFVAWPFTRENIASNTEGITSDNLVSYKSTKNEVANGNKAEMVIRIVQTHEGTAGEAETYAKSFDEAVTIINNLNDKTASYRMEILRGSAETPLLTTKNGTVFGKMTLPSKASEVTIEGANDSEAVAIAYKGSLAVNCDTIFDNVILLEDNERNNVSVSYKGAYGLTFTESVESDEDYAILTIDSVKASKGTLALDNAAVYVVGAIAIKDVETIGESSLVVDGKATITNIYGAGNDSSKLSLDYSFSTKNVTQLTISGNISDVELELVPNLYDKESDSYYPVSVDTVIGKQLATMPKASIEDVTVGYWNEAGNFQTLTGGILYKQNGGLYFTTESALVEVVAEDAYGNEEPEVYRSRFLSWDYAVKEIDKRADASLVYRMILKDDIGGVTGGEAPIKTLTLPAKAKEVTVTSETGERNCIFFTDTKITLKTNTTFENVGLFAVKKVSSENGGVYDSVTYNFSTGKYDLTLKDLIYVASENIWRKLGTVSGNGKGTFTALLGSEEENDVFVVDKISKFATVNIYNEVEDDMVYENQVVSSGLITKGMSDIGTLNLYPGTVISCDAGSVSAKNGTIRGSVLFAKDITISQNVTLESAKLIAGSDSVGDGKLSLGNVIVEDSNNYLEAKLSKQNKSQLSISGTVTASPYYIGSEDASAIEVALLDKEGGAYVALAEGLDVINATKAEAFWFAPKYTNDEEGQLVEGMGWYDAAFGLYNTTKTIKYGRIGM